MKKWQEELIDAGVVDENGNLLKPSLRAKKLRANAEIYFNYETKFNDMWIHPGAQKKYGFTALYPAAKGACTVIDL